MPFDANAIAFGDKEAIVNAGSHDLVGDWRQVNKAWRFLTSTTFWPNELTEQHNGWNLVVDLFSTST